MILTASLGQVSLKKGMKRFGTFSLDFNLIKKLPGMFFQPYVFLGVIFYGISLIVWLIVVSKLDLSYVYPMEALSYFLVVIMSIYIFGEQVSKKRWLALGIILIGVCVLAIS